MPNGSFSLPLGDQRRMQAVVWALAIALSAAVWIIVLTQVRQEERSAVQAAVAQNVNRAIALEQYVRRTLEAAELAMLHVIHIHGENLQAPAGAAARLIDDDIARNPSWAGISIVNAQGEMVASTLPDLRGHGNVSAHPAFVAQQQGAPQRLYVSAPAHSRYFGGNYIWLSRRISGPDGSFRGVVAVNIAPAQFTRLLDQAGLGRSEVLSVIGLDGITRARRTGNALSHGEDLRGGLVMQMQMRRPNGTYLGPSVLDGIDRYFSHRRLPEYALFVTSGVSREQVLAPARERARGYYLAASAVTLFCLIMLTIFLLLLKRRQQRISEMEDSYRRLEEAQRIGRIGDWSWDFASRQTHWSPELLRMYGRSEEEGAPSYAEYLELIGPEGRAQIEETMQRLRDTGQAQSCRFRTEIEGRTMWREVMAVPLFTPGGTLVGLQGTDQDVSESEELEQLRDHMAQASRVEAMNAMASTLAHELNQPLTAARNFVSGARRVLDRDGNDSDLGHVRTGLRSAEQQIGFAAEIIRRVRSMVSRDRRMMESVKLRPVWRDTNALLDAADPGSRVRVRERISSDATTVWADRVQLQQVLVNLSRNARLAVADAPRQEIGLETELTRTGLVRITVSDTGAGFPDDLDDPFASLTSSNEIGLGLGLSVSRTIVEAHGGKIWIERADGITRVHFTLPAEAPAARRAA